MAKGKEEGIVGHARQNFMGPIPRSPSWDAVNADLEAQCRKRRNDILRGHKETIGDRVKRDLAAMAPLPGPPFKACAPASGQVSSQSLVRCKTKDHAVPPACGRQDDRLAWFQIGSRPVPLISAWAASAAMKSREARAQAAFSSACAIFGATV